MSKCRFCNHSTKDPNHNERFMFVNRDNTLCADCAITNEVQFENRVTGKKVIIIAAQSNQFVPGGQLVRINYNNEKVFEITKMDFEANHVEVKA